MKVAYILSRLQNQGPFIVAHTLCEKLKNKIDKIDIFYIEEKITLEFNQPVKRISFFSNDVNFDEYDVCHSHGLKADIYVYLNRSRIRGKCITTMHQYNGEQLKYYYSNVFVAKVMEFVWKRCISRHDLVVALSKHMMNYYKAYLRETQSVGFVYNGRDACKNSEEIPAVEKTKLENIKSRYTVIGAVGGLIKRKGFDQLVRVLQKDGNLFLVLIGDGNEKENLFNLAKNLNVDQRCWFVGYKKNPLGYYHYFDIYGMTSYAEGFPLVLIESAAMKVPAICTDRELFRELFTNDEVSYFKLDDTESLYKSILNIKNNHDRFANNLHSKYTHNFNAEKMATRYLDIYNNLSTGK